MSAYRSIWSSAPPAGPPPRGLLADWTGKRSRSLPPCPACPSGCRREGGPGLPLSGAASPGSQRRARESIRWDCVIWARLSVIPILRIPTMSSTRNRLSRCNCCQWILHFTKTTLLVFQICRDTKCTTCSKLNISIHPSIHYRNRLSSVGCWGAGAN